MIELSSGSVRVASIEDLIAMKKTTGRPEDRADIEALEALRDERKIAIRQTTGTCGEPTSTSRGASVLG